MRTRILFLLLFFVSTAKAQYRFTHIDQRQGLSQNSVNCILEDTEGFMWFGTQDGLNLYDGYTFKIFRHTAGDTKTLRDNFIISMAEDTSGNIWIGTRNGLCIYDKAMQCFNSLIRNENKILQHHAQIQKIVSTQDGSVLFKDAFDNLVCARYEHGKFMNIAVITTDISGFDLKDNNLYIIRNNQLEIFDFPHYSIKKKIPCDFRFRKNTASSYGDEGMWLVHESGVEELNCESGRSSSLAECLNTNCIFDDQENNLIWIGTENGLIIINGNNKVNLKSESVNNFSLSDSHITCFYKSTDGLLWIGTATGGVNIYDSFQNFFAVHNRISDPPIESGPVWAIQSLDRGTIICSSSGMSFLPETNKPAWWKILPDTAFIMCTKFDDHGNLWLGSRTGGIYVADTLNYSLKHLTTSNSGLHSNQIRDLCYNESGMWVATLYGLHLMLSDQSWKWYPKSTHPDSLGSGYIQHLYTDQLNQMWVSSAEGVYRYDTNKDKFINYCNSNSEIISYPVVNSVNQLSTGEYVFCTMGGGADIYSPLTGKTIHLNTHSGLTNNVVYGCLEDVKGRLWFSTNDGIQIADFRNNCFDVKNMNDGLPADEFAIGAFEKSPDGRFWFGTTDGAVSFFPQEFIPSHITTRPFIVELRAGNKTISERDEVVLESDQRDVNIRFSAIDYRHQEHLRYEYRLLGYDTAWRENAPGDRTSKYTNLPYGSYIYELRLKSGNATYGTNVLTLSIHLPAPFWTTWWFRIIMIAAIVATTAYVVNFYLQRKWQILKRKIENERQINSERKRISDDLHDNVGAQLTYIVSALDNAEYRLSKLPESDDIKNRISSLGDYTRNTITKLRESIWAIRSEAISVNDFAAKISGMIIMFGDSYPDKTLRFISSESDEVLPPEVAIESLRITQEAVANAIKHSSFTEMSVEIQSTSEVFIIQINDNGEGFDLSKRKTGHYGLENMSARADKIGAKLIIDSAPGKGTAVKLVWIK